MKYYFHVLQPKEYSQKVSEEIIKKVREILNFQKICSIILSGGKTPEEVYKLLSDNSSIEWNKVHFFFSDERYIPHTNNESNFYLAYESLFKNIHISKENIHAIPTDYDDPSDAAICYQAEINEYFFKYSTSKGSFDIVLLGLGEDCHTASLFPGSKQLFEEKSLVVPVFNSPKPPSTRITLTFPILNKSKNIYFLVTGEKKAEAVKKVVESNEPIEKCPAKGVIPHNPPVWMLDVDSSGLISV